MSIVEKPCSHNPYEGELLIEAVRKYQRVLQMGNQRRSFPEHSAGGQEIHDGIIGRAYFGRAWYDNAARPPSATASRRRFPAGWITNSGKARPRGGRTGTT